MFASTRRQSSRSNYTCASSHLLCQECTNAVLISICSDSLSVLNRTCDHSYMHTYILWLVVLPRQSFAFPLSNLQSQIFQSDILELRTFCIHNTTYQVYMPARSTLHAFFFRNAQLIPSHLTSSRSFLSVCLSVCLSVFLSFCFA
jgi:hypothetical protein